MSLLEPESEGPGLKVYGLMQTNRWTGHTDLSRPNGQSRINNVPFILSLFIVILKVFLQMFKKNKPTNILSFPLSKKEGEILICPSITKKQLKKFGRTYPELLQFLVIHGLLHLKGMQHSSRMEVSEQKYDKKYFHWNRSRIH